MPIFPNSIDYELARSKNLYPENINDKYYLLQKKYQTVLEKYLNDILNLKGYDDFISHSNLKFNVTTNKDYYQQSSTLELNYIYIKNNLHIEKLSNEDLDNLSKDINVLDIVKRTYKNIIKISCLNNKKCPDQFKTQYFESFDTDKTVFNNDSLIFIIKAEVSNANDDSFWIDVKNKQIFLKNLVNKMNNDFKNKLDCKVEICEFLV